MGNCSTAMEAVGSLPVLAAALIRACAALFVRRPGSGQARPRWRPHRARLVLVRCADETLEIGSSPTLGSEGKAQAGACSPRRPWGGGSAVWCPRRSRAAAAVGRIRAREDGVRRHGAGPWRRCGRAAREASGFSTQRLSLPAMWGMTTYLTPFYVYMWGLSRKLVAILRAAWGLDLRSVGCVLKPDASVPRATWSMRWCSGSPRQLRCATPSSGSARAPTVNRSASLRSSIGTPGSAI